MKKLVQILFVFLTLTLFAPASALAQWGGPPSNRGNAQPAQPARPAQPKRHGGGGGTTKWCDKEGKRILASLWTKERCEKKPECMFGKNDKGECVPWEEAFNKKAEERVAEAKIAFRTAFFVGMPALALLFLVLGYRRNRKTDEILEKLMLACANLDIRVSSLDGHELPDRPVLTAKKEK